MVKKYLFVASAFLAITTPSFPKEIRDVWVTVFVHGIMGVDAKTCFSNAFQFFTDHISNTAYARAIDHMRTDPFFQKNQAMQNLGLQPIDLKNYEPGYASGAIARTFNHVLSLSPRKQYSLYATFGWSGLLSFKARHSDAQHFYRSLYLLCEKIKSRGLNPKIRLLGYSHGANICLNLADVQQEEPYASMPLEIDELILLGAPIQRETEKLVKHPIFKKVYNFYSRSDYVQKKDMFSSQQFFSKRVFSNRREFTLPASLTQIEVRLLVEKQRSRRKSKKIAGIVSKAADVRKKSVLKGHWSGLKNMSPGHTELWFMEWTPRNYRKDFPLYPVPLAVVTPYLIQLIEATVPQINKSRRVVIDIRPDHNYMIIKHRYPKKQFLSISFLAPDVFKKLDKISKSNRPEEYTRELHDEHRAQAHQKAHEERKKLVKLRRANRGKRIICPFTLSQPDQHITE